MILFERPNVTTGSTGGSWGELSTEGGDPLETEGGDPIVI